MSTKSSIKWGDGYHLYDDFIDKVNELDVVNLELTGVEFSVWNGGVCVAIPREIARKLGLIPEISTGEPT